MHRRANCTTASSCRAAFLTWITGSRYSAIKGRGHESYLSTSNAADGYVQRETQAHKDLQIQQRTQNRHHPLHPPFPDQKASEIKKISLKVLSKIWHNTQTWLSLNAAFSKQMAPGELPRKKPKSICTIWPDKNVRQENP